MWWKLQSTFDPYARISVSDKVKHMTKSNLTSRVKETRFLVQHESCKCKCASNKIICNSTQK